MRVGAILDLSGKEGKNLDLADTGPSKHLKKNIYILSTGTEK